MPDLREVVIDPKWQVLTADIGGGKVVSEHDDRAEATEAAIAYKTANPGYWVTVYHKRETYVVIDSA